MYGKQLIWSKLQDLLATYPKAIPKKKKCKKAKWLSEEAIQIAEERSEVNGKGERGRHN